MAHVARQSSYYSRRRDPTFLATLILLGVIVILSLRVSDSDRSHHGGNSGGGGGANGKIYRSIDDVVSSILSRSTHRSASGSTTSSSCSLDVIFVLGGGVPSSLYEPPMYVQQRCDDAVAIRERLQQSHNIMGHHGMGDVDGVAPTTIPILTLSAGTAHLPQLLTKDGLPIWESTSSAAYLQRKHGVTDNVFLETTSYDTIGNAYFARTSHTDIVGWRNILVITNEFHIERTKAIFDWVFGILPSQERNPIPYHISYFSSKDIGLSDGALLARRHHEERSTETIQTILSKKYKTMKDMWEFINQHHDLYTTNTLIQGATQAGVTNVRNDALKESYGSGGAGGRTKPVE